MISEITRGDRFTKLADKKFTNSLLNVWDLSKQYSLSDLSLFKNPAFKIISNVVQEIDSDEMEPPKRTIKLLAKYYKEKPTDAFINVDLLGDHSRSLSDQLYPEIYCCQLTFWSVCFLRWLTPIQVMGGGLSMEYILESLLQEEVKSIENTIQQMQQINDTSANASDVAANVEFAPFWSTKRNLLDNLTSSFPYTPSRPTTQVSFFGTPIKMCMEELTTSSELEASTSSIGDVCES
jgi:hypothetical protein